MILSALCDYYDRLSNDPDSGIAPSGFSSESISYAIVLNKKGEIVAVDDIRDTSGKKPMPRKMIVPQSVVRAAGVTPFFLWDKTSYCIGVSNISKRTDKEYESFKSMHLDRLTITTDEGLQAFTNFLQCWEPSSFDSKPLFESIKEEFVDSNAVFRLDGCQNYIHECLQARQIIEQTASGDAVGLCLVTGKKDSIARLHPSIKGVRDAQSSGAAIVSFNLASFESYGKKQGENAPVSETATFKYTTALNHLLRKDTSNRQKIEVGDTTMVFWADAVDSAEADAAEDMFAAFLSPSDKDAQESDKIRLVFEHLRQGKPLGDVQIGLKATTKIHVLGIVPNASRLSIRFWETNTLEGFSNLLEQHFNDISLVPSPWKFFPSVWKLASMTIAMDAKNKPRGNEKISPKLAGEITRSILTGGMYPLNLLNLLLMRIRSDDAGTATNGYRTALIKGVLTRFYRVQHNENKRGGIPMSLDTANTDPGYVLGRLFATLETIQRGALGKDVNATIRDRYFGAASATPANVFPMLIRNAQNHLGKIRKDNPGWAYTLEKQVAEIVGLIDSRFPKSLRLEAQGHFAIGYYHQASSYYKNASTDENTEEGGEEE